MKNDNGIKLYLNSAYMGVISHLGGIETNLTQLKEEQKGKENFESNR